MKLSNLTKQLTLSFTGDDKEIVALNSLAEASEKEITYFKDEKFLEGLKSTKAGVIILSQKYKEYAPKNASLVFSDNPYLTMAYTSQVLHKEHHKASTKKPTISTLAHLGLHVSIGNGSVIEDDVTLMNGVSVGENVTIKKGAYIHPNVTIYDNVTIGKNCIILANSVIGSDGFGYAHTNLGEHIKIIHTGQVILEDNVDIGACTTIDRGVFGATILKKGTKIDNLVQIGHNCELRENCIIVSQTGLSGSTKLGRGVVMGGQSGTSGHLSIGDYAQIAGRGGVSKSLEGGKTYGGFPIQLQRDWLRFQAKLLKLLKTQ